MLVATLADGVDELDGRQLAARLADVERTMRQLERVAVAVIDAADRRRAYVEDGHASVRGWVRASVRVSDREVTARVRTMELLRELPSCADALADGRLGIAQVRELARAHANPRCGDQFVDVAELLVRQATTLPYEVFARSVRHWERLADADGAHRGHERAHAARRASLSQVGDTYHLSAQFGVAQGAAIADVLARFCDAEFHAEWDELRARHGDEACPALLERTVAQRRADAIAAIFARAAATPAGAHDPEPLVNIIIDQATYEAYLARRLGADVPTPDAATFDERRCETVDGVLIDPEDAVAASFVGRIRRVVYDSAGVVINLGRRCRLFTGAARDAARLQGTRCTWPGCGRQQCQIDHITEWAHGGSTDQVNAGSRCPRHNRWKSRGYRTWRDPNGAWHTIRPDGTEIEAA